MRIRWGFVLFQFFFLTSLYVPAIAQPEIPSLEKLKSQFGDSYSCPGNNGLGTFTANVSSDQIKAFAQNFRLAEPRLKLHFSHANSFYVENEAEIPKSQQEKVLQDLADAIQQTTEGFFQSYVTLGFSNVLDEISASVTIRIDEGKIHVEYPDVAPNQFVLLSFDANFHLLKLETKDVEKNVKTIMTPTWKPHGGKLVLASLETEYFPSLTEKSNFMTRMKIENSQFGRFFLPAHVTVQARESGDGPPSNTFIDFKIDNYEFSSTKK